MPTRTGESDRVLCIIERSRSHTYRNRIFHDVRYYTEDNYVSRFQSLAKSKLVFGSTPETIEKLEKFCIEVDTATVEFLAIWLIVLKIIEETPGKLLQQFRRIVADDVERLAPTIGKAKRRRRVQSPEFSADQLEAFLNDVQSESDEEKTA